MRSHRAQTSMSTYKKKPIICSESSKKQGSHQKKQSKNSAKVSTTRTSNQQQAKHQVVIRSKQAGSKANSPTVNQDNVILTTEQKIHNQDIKQQI